MDQSNCGKYLAEIMDRFAKGSPMSADARAHYVTCTNCMTAVTEELAKNCEAKTDSQKSDAARAALARGRKVLERELGIPANHPVGAK